MLLKASHSDATSAYRGYRLQTLYTLLRVLEQRDSTNLIFQPEGKEDLAIFDTEHPLIEVIQVKERSQNLTLSSFEPDKKDSFFYRAASEVTNHPNIQISLVAFGSVGPELKQGLENSGRERLALARKLASYQYLSEAEAIALLSKIKLTHVEETDLTNRVNSILQSSLPSVDPESAFNLLMYWLYVCAESKREITQSDIIDRVNKVGWFIAECAAHQREWFISIIPIEDRVISELNDVDELRDEFYQGISARYEHVLANIDVQRPQKLQEIANGFKDKRIVILHAASGQGKTTLAYRYLHDFFPQYWRFQVRTVSNPEQAASIALALSAHADAIGVPLVVYLDVTARDRDWPELVKHLSNQRNIQVLVTIREEDWRRANISGAELQFHSVELSFEREEAENIYIALAMETAPLNVLDFNEAWRKFGEDGPLMEFVHLITQGSSLYERLSQQVTRLVDEVRERRLAAEELELLRLTSVVSAFESRLQLKPLVEHLRLPAPQGTLKLFEKEYLLRVSSDGSLVGGLHPIRSAMLSNLLNDPTFTSWAESAGVCLQFIEERDVEPFLLYSFSRHRNELNHLLGSLTLYQPKSWTATAGVIRALIWLGMADYIETNQDLIQEAAKTIGQGWAFFLDFDIAGLNTGAIEALLKAVEEIVQSPGREIAEKLQARQSDKKVVFERVTEWLSRRTEKPASPMTETEWDGAAEAIFWVSHLSIDWPLSQWVSEHELDNAIESLRLETMASLILALATSQKFEAWLEKNRQQYIARLRRETLSVALEDDGEKVTIHFVFDLDELNEAASDESQERIYIPKDRFNWEAMRRIGLLRKLLPSQEEYASQGYGHLLWENFLPHDESMKTGISRLHLPLSWLTSVNAIFGGLGNQIFRPETWQQYAHEMWNLRHTVLHSMKQLERAIEIYFRRQQAYQMFGNQVNEEEWALCKGMLNDPPRLPKVAVDEWGFVDESTSPESVEERSNRSSLISRNGLALQKYKPFLKAFNEYTQSFSNFFFKATDVINMQPHIGRSSDRSRVLEKAEELGLDLRSPHLTTYNLAEVIKNLPQLHHTSRLILKPFFKKSALDKLEHDEQKAISKVWAMWYFLAFHPEKIMQNAATQCVAEMAKIMRTIRLDLRQRLRRLSLDGVKITLAAEDILWNQEPALWLIIDTHNPLDVYKAIGDVINSVNAAVRKVRSSELRRYTLDFYWPYIIIVPLVRGKYLNATAWRIKLPLILGKEINLNWWNLAQEKIPSSSLQQLNLQAWDLSQLTIGVNLLQSTSTLFSLAAHIRDFLRLPVMDDEGGTYLQEYVNRLNNHLSEALQSVIDSEAEMLNVINEIPTHELEKRPALMEVAQGLSELHKRVLPTPNFEKQATIALGDLKMWCEQLQEAPLYALVASHAWYSDVLDQSI